MGANEVHWRRLINFHCEFVELSKIIGHDFIFTYNLDSTLKINLTGYLVIAIDTQVSLCFVIMMDDASDLMGDAKGPPSKRARPETPNTELGK